MASTRLVLIVINLLTVTVHCHVIDKTFSKLEKFWRLGWKGYEEFPNGGKFDHHRGVHVNHHRWPSQKPYDFAGLPVEGIIERKHHPYHQRVASHYKIPIGRHLAPGDEGPAGAQHHYSDHLPFGEDLDPKYTRFYDRGGNKMALPPPPPPFLPFPEPFPMFAGPPLPPLPPPLPYPVLDVPIEFRPPEMAIYEHFDPIGFDYDGIPIKRKK
ncbi:hypothetical protein HDE_09858 [Halotydeus destructor]|nr:hypothetical protein HDE_09858 [Halotydeus destructor]